MKIDNFLAELKRRNVYKVAVAYAVIAWLLIQAASILLPTFEAPSWVMKVFVVLVTLGFPIALVLAWAFEATPEGIKRTEEVDLSGQRVTQILEGSVQRSGDKVRIHVQLIDALADSHLWAKSYDGDAKDIFAVETEVSQQVADALRAKLSPEEAKTLAKAPTQDPDAYDLFLRAEAQTRAAQAALTAEAFDRAVALYAEALHRDPNFALAAARMAEARLWEHWYV